MRRFADCSRDRVRRDRWVVQGSLTPAAARLLHVPMRVVEPEPWALGVRLRDEPSGVHRLTIKPGSPADGRTIDELADLPGDAWVSFIVRDGQIVPVKGDTKLRAGDDVLVLAPSELDKADRRLRRPPPRNDPLKSSGPSVACGRGCSRPGTQIKGLKVRSAPGCLPPLGPLGFYRQPVRLPAGQPVTVQYQPCRPAKSRQQQYEGRSGHRHGVDHQIQDIGAR